MDNLKFDPEVKIGRKGVQWKPRYRMFICLNNHTSKIDLAIWPLDYDFKCSKCGEDLSLQKKEKK